MSIIYFCLYSGYQVSNTMIYLNSHLAHASKSENIIPSISFMISKSYFRFCISLFLLAPHLLIEGYDSTGECQDHCLFKFSIFVDHPDRSLLVQQSVWPFQPFNESKKSVLFI